MFTWRHNLWIAPRLHQFFFATAILLVGASQLFYGYSPFDTVGLHYRWLVFSQPAAIVWVIFGALGWLTAIGNGSGVMSYGRVVFSMGNVVFYTLLCWIFGTQFRVGTIIYPMVLLWSIWFLLRVISDKHIKVSLVRIVEIEIKERK